VNAAEVMPSGLLSFWVVEGVDIPSNAEVETAARNKKSSQQAGKHVMLQNVAT
jgi:hypothetical protein